jgi:hypothetical protein
MPRAWHAGVQHSLGKLQASFRRTWAPTGHRGRVDARGARSGGAPGLTRTSDRSAGAPSRDGRSAAPAAPRGLTFPDEEAVASRTAERRNAAGVVPCRSRKGATAGWPKVRVKPGAVCRRWPRASTRPRWAVDAKTPLKNGTPSLPANVCWLPAMRGRGDSGDSSQRSSGGGAPQAAGGHERRRVRRVAAPTPAHPANRR